MRLGAKLVELDTQYYGLNLIRRMQADPDETGNVEVVEGDPQANATLTAAGSLAAVVGALRELPTFQGNVGLQALIDLGNALLDLDKGLRPALLQPRPGQVSTTDHSGRRALKAHVVLCVELLELAGYSPTAAQKEIANIFGAAGFTGRKRALANDGLSWKTVHEWTGALAMHGTDREGRRIIDDAIRGWKLKRNWPPQVDDVLAFARSRAADPSLATTI